MDPKYIIVHHSLTKDSKTVSWSAIDRYHTKTLGWSDIGYHYGIELIGTEYEVLAGRMPDVRGAHCTQEGMNKKSLGVCLVGNFDKTEVPQAMWDKAVDLVKSLCNTHNISHERVLAHNQLAHYKSCPGTKFDMDKFRADLDR